MKPPTPKSIALVPQSSVLANLLGKNGKPTAKMATAVNALLMMPKQEMAGTHSDSRLILKNFEDFLNRHSGTASSPRRFDRVALP